MNNTLRIAYITTKDREEARHIGRMLVHKRLAACVNIIDGMESMYHWDGNVVEDTECILIAKTTQQHFQTLTELVKKEHSYECPCVISFSIAENEGNAEYLQWLLRETN